MGSYELEPLKSLTPEDISRIIIHHTVSGLRRAASITPCMKRVDATDKVPTLYYIKGDPNPNINDWKIHALVADLSRFSLNDTSGDDPDPGPEPPGPGPIPPDPHGFIRSRFLWDGFTGKTANGIWVNPVYFGRYNEHLIFESSEIAYYNRLPYLPPMPGNYVGLQVIPDISMINRFRHNIRVLIEGSDLPAHIFNEDIFFHHKQFGRYTPCLYFYPLIRTLNGNGPEYRINIKWGNEFEESFVAIIYGQGQGIKSCTLQPRQDDPSPSPSINIIETFEDLETALRIGGRFEIGNNIEFTNTIPVTSDVTLVLNTYKLYNNTDLKDPDNNRFALITVDGGTLNIEGPGEIWTKENDVYPINVINGGKLNIKANVKVTGNRYAIQCDRGYVLLEGGEYNLQQLDESLGAQLLLNCTDANYFNGSAVIEVKGGKFRSFDPGNNLSNGIDTNYLASGYKSILLSDNYYAVCKLRY